MKSSQTAIQKGLGPDAVPGSSYLACPRFPTLLPYPMRLQLPSISEALFLVAGNVIQTELSVSGTRVRRAFTEASREATKMRE